MKKTHPQVRPSAGKSTSRPGRNLDQRVALPPLLVTRATLAKLKFWSVLYDKDLERTIEAAINQL